MNERRPTDAAGESWRKWGARPPVDARSFGDTHRTYTVPLPRHVGLRCRLGLHRWPDAWTKVGRRTLVDFDGVWFKIYEKFCERGCGASRTHNGPLRYSESLGGEIMLDQFR